MIAQLSYSLDFIIFYVYYKMSKIVKLFFLWFHKQVESFILDQEDLDNPVLKTTSELFLSSAAEGADLRTVDPETQARLEALLEAAGTLRVYFFFWSQLAHRYGNL